VFQLSKLTQPQALVGDVFVPPIQLNGPIVDATVVSGGPSTRSCVPS
jgi:hypothetical protein